MGQRRSLVREAYGLPPVGGLVVVPDEFCAMAARYGLIPAERMTLVALLRRWNPRVNPTARASASLKDLRGWTGLGQSQQSITLRELLTAWNPPLLTVLVEGKKGVPTVYDLRPLVRAIVGSVRHTERIPRAVGSDHRTKSRRLVRTTDDLGSGHRTDPSAIPAQMLETKTEVRPLAGCTDAELKVWRFLPTADERHMAAWNEWRERMKERNGKAVGNGKA